MAYCLFRFKCFLFLPYHFSKVYDGWNSTGQVLYDELDSSKPAQVKSVIYSVSQKMMIRFTRPKVSCSSRVWSVTTVSKKLIHFQSIFLNILLSLKYADPYGFNHQKSGRDDRNNKKSQLSSSVPGFLRLPLENLHGARHKRSSPICVV